MNGCLQAMLHDTIGAALPELTTKKHEARWLGGEDMTKCAAVRTFDVFFFWWYFVVVRCFDY